MARKTPTNIERPIEGKVARGGSRVNEIANLPIAWHLRILDKNGPWGWDKINGSTFWEDIYPTMRNFSTMTWNEILGRNHHEIKKTKICREAQERLREIKQDDVDNLVSLHLTGKKIIWGIRKHNICKLLWWDPYHTVYPTRKKHT